MEVGIMKKIPNKVTILGTDYNIKVHKFEEDETLIKNSWAGYCSQDEPLIVLADYDNNDKFKFDSDIGKDNYTDSCLRHEIIHAFLNESGLKDSSTISDVPWAKNEEMVDWLAIQFPKMLKVFHECGVV